MSWAFGFDSNWNRDIGYGVPATCDAPGCGAEIDRGLAHVCGGAPYGGEKGCGLYFCPAHLYMNSLCWQCGCGEEPYDPTPDRTEWIEHKLSHESWSVWRDTNSSEVGLLRAELERRANTSTGEPT